MAGKESERYRLLFADKSNIECIDLTLSTPEIKADVIVSSMAMHHIDDVSALLRTFTNMLTPGGYIALADLDTEPGTFHPDNTGIYHFGFNREWFAGELEKVGFKNIDIRTAYTIERPNAEGAMVSYPIFLISGNL